MPRLSYVMRARKAPMLSLRSKSCLPERRGGVCRSLFWKLHKLQPFVMNDASFPAHKPLLCTTRRSLCSSVPLFGVDAFLSPSFLDNYLLACPCFATLLLFHHLGCPGESLIISKPNQFLPNLAPSHSLSLSTHPTNSINPILVWSVCFSTQTWLRPLALQP
jgi:hypothetical protein